MQNPEVNDLIVVHLTPNELNVIKANLSELAQSGRLGNADSITLRLETGIERAEKAGQTTENKK